MKKRKTKTEKKTRELTPWEKNYRSYKHTYNAVICIGITITIAIFCFASMFWGFACLAFGLWSLAWYEDGATENCMDEYEYAYAKDGFRKMLKSWPWFAVLLLIAYFFCKKFMPWCLT